ncbi:MAG TPA: ABC transporter ATP-binding protein [Candidatus Rubrimentiphilum sp.]|nr:ABC transporter ATP-binding protein [Candidatus Rubrimentiphilum sp.]
MAVAARDLTKYFFKNGLRRTALDGVSFSVRDRERLVVLGPSGAGKTTLLRVIAGLERADEGSIFIDDRNAGGLPPEKRRVAIVFDRDGLFPHLTLRRNLAFALRGDRTGNDRIEGAARDLGIAAHLDKRPGELSAGERQRASLARAILSDPRVLLLDEPLSHLEPSLRAQVRRTFLAFSSSFGGAVVHVTHDHAEALTSGDRLAVMIGGKILQCDSPQRVYDYPANASVARFFGTPPMNLIDDGMETLGIRPENVRLQNGGSLRGRVIAVESTGADAFVRMETPKGELIARVPAASVPHVGEEVAATLPQEHVRRFDRSGGAAIA